MKKIIAPLMTVFLVAGCASSSRFSHDSIDNDQRLANIYYTSSNHSQCGDRSLLQENTITILDNIARLHDDPDIMIKYAVEVQHLSTSATNLLSDQRRGVLTNSACIVYLDSIAAQAYNIAEQKDQ